MMRLQSLNPVTSPYSLYISYSIREGDRKLHYTLILDTMGNKASAIVSAPGR
ncbi:MAG: hypothetical protein HW402_1517 [Dehalococcoidales bacterium]|nr:hypothetical protein [Dehalococcoidales bacterium]